MAESEETLYGSNTSHTYSLERVPTGSTQKSNVSSRKLEDPSHLSDIALVNYPKVWILSTFLLQHNYLLNVDGQ